MGGKQGWTASMTGVKCDANVTCRCRACISSPKINSSWGSFATLLSVHQSGYVKTHPAYFGTPTAHANDHVHDLCCAGMLPVSLGPSQGLLWLASMLLHHRTGHALTQQTAL